VHTGNTDDKKEYNPDPNSLAFEINDSFETILTFFEVDERRTMSNDLQEIYKIFGIEAVRNYIIEEISILFAQQDV
jgi:DNA-directed RNA polymerase beta' subunit